eukprot:76198-Chlamydomonas_euryale.AAC.1
MVSTVPAMGMMHLLAAMDDLVLPFSPTPLHTSPPPHTHAGADRGPAGYGHDAPACGHGRFGVGLPRRGAPAVALPGARHR